MGLKNCCLKYARAAQPKNEGVGVFLETHLCPGCGQELKITFQELVELGDGLSEYAVISIDPPGSTHE